MPPTLLPDAFRRDVLAGLRALYGPRLAAVRLFGSYARGEAVQESDADLLVVLRGEVDRAAEGWRLADLSIDLMAAHGMIVPEFVLVDEEAYLRANWPLLRNVREEPVALCMS
jgi:uncharacterized protein